MLFQTKQSSSIATKMEQLLLPNRKCLKHNVSPSLCPNDPPINEISGLGASSSTIISIISSSSGKSLNFMNEFSSRLNSFRPHCKRVQRSRAALMSKRPHASEFLAAKRSMLRNDVKVAFHRPRRSAHRAGVCSPSSNKKLSKQ